MFDLNHYRQCEGDNHFDWDCPIESKPSKFLSSLNILSSPQFWLGITFTFPIEHFLWTQVWPFSWLNDWFHLLH